MKNWLLCPPVPRSGLFSWVSWWTRWKDSVTESRNLSVPGAGSGLQRMGHCLLHLRARRLRHPQAARITVETQECSMSPWLLPPLWPLLTTRVPYVVRGTEQ